MHNDNIKNMESAFQSKGYLGPLFRDCPRVSVITVVLNCCCHIELAIQSVIEQSYSNLEYIVIDGGSTDGTLDIIRKYEDHIDYWVSEPDLGISDAFNNGIARCTGDLIGTLNADDSYLPGAITLVAAAFREDAAARIIHGGMVGVWGKKTARISTRPLPHLFWYFDTPYYHPASFVPRIVYEQLGNYDIDYHYAMDYDFFLRANMAGVPFHRVSGELTRYSFGGRSGSNPLAAYREVLRAQRKHGLNSLLCTAMFCLKFLVNRSKWLYKSIANKTICSPFLL